MVSILWLLLVVTVNPSAYLSVMPFGVLALNVFVASVVVAEGIEEDALLSLQDNKKPRIKNNNNCFKPNYFLQK